MRRRLGRPAAAEELAEQIAEAGSGAPSPSPEIESAEIEMHVAGVRSLGHSAGAWRFEAELIVHLAFFGVGKDVVSFLHLLELFFRGFIAGIQVGMIFSRELSVSLTDFLLRRLARDAQQIVVVLFS